MVICFLRQGFRVFGGETKWDQIKEFLVRESGARGDLRDGGEKVLDTSGLYYPLLVLSR